MPENLTLREVVFVDDGSTDRTKLKIKNEKLKLEKRLKTKVILLSYPTNRGKGYAVRKGLAQVTADYGLLFDADISTPLTEISKFSETMEQGTDVIIGTRKNGKSTVVKHQPLLRETLGKGFTLITRYSLGVHVTDFTCGFKAFSRRALEQIVPELQINRWGYDAEILLVATQKQLVMREIPVIWSNDTRTRVKLHKDVPQTLWDLMCIVWMHRIPFTSVLPTSAQIADDQITVR